MPYSDLKVQREYQRLNNKEYHRYAKCAYNHILRRLKSKTSYQHRKLLFSQQEFLNWIFNNPKYAELHRQWKQSGYDLKLSPSIDRIDNNKDYSLDNIQVITTLENSLKAYYNDHAFSEPLNKKKVLCPQTGEVYDSVAEAARKLNLNNKMVSRVANGQNHQTRGYTFKFV